MQMISMCTTKRINLLSCCLTGLVADLRINLVFADPVVWIGTAFIIPVVLQLGMFCLCTVFPSPTIWLPLPPEAEIKSVREEQAKIKHQFVMEMDWQIFCDCNNLCEPSCQWSPIHPFPFPLSVCVSEPNPQVFLELTCECLVNEETDK